MKRNIIKMLAAAICVSVSTSGSFYDSYVYGEELSKENVVSEKNEKTDLESKDISSTEIDKETSSENEDDKKDDTSNAEGDYKEDEGSTDKKEDSSEESEKEDTSETVEKEKDKSQLAIIARINNGTADLDDYQALGILYINNDNLEDVSWYAKKHNVNTIESIQENTTKLIRALENVSGGTSVLSYYKTLEIDHANQENIEVVGMAMYLARERKGKTLTRSEIIEIFNEKVYNPFKRVSAGKGLVNDFAELHIPNVTEENLEDVNWYEKYNKPATISVANDNAQNCLKSIEEINSGSASSGSYRMLGMEYVDDDNVIIANEAVLKEKGTKGRNLKRSEIYEVAKEAIDKVISNFNSGTATLEDYKKLGCDEVTEDNIESVNKYLKTADSSTILKIKNNTNIVIISIENINKGTLSMDFYDIAGITGLNDERCEVAKKLILKAKEEKGSNLTVAEIQAVIDENLVGPLDRINSGNATLEDYTQFGINNVTADNLKDVNWCVKNTKNDTANDLQTNIDTFLKSLEAINLDKATANDFNIVGVSDVINSQNSGCVRKYIKQEKINKGRNLTRDEIIEVATENVVNPMQRIQKGQGTLDDYKALGIEEATDKLLEDLRWVNSDKDHENASIIQIEKSCKALISSLVNISKGTEKLGYYSEIGLKDKVTSENIRYMAAQALNKSQNGNKILSRSEIIQIVDEGIVYIDNSLALIKEGKATVDIYNKLTIKNVTEDNLEDVNWAEKNNKPSTIGEASSYSNAVIDALKYVNAGQKYISYYNILGIDCVNSDNIQYIKDEVLIKKKEKGSNLTRVEIEKVAKTVAKKVDEAIERIKAGNGIKEDYQLLKMSRVTDINIADVNWYLSSCSFTGVVKVNQITSKVSNIVSALSNINSGTTSTSYYKTLGITSVTSSNAKQVKTAILAAKSANGKNLNRTQIIEVVDRTVSAN